MTINSDCPSRASVASSLNARSLLLDQQSITRCLPANITLCHSV